MMRQPGTNAGFDVRLRTLRILWAVFLITIGLYTLVTRFSLPPEEVLQKGGHDNPTLLMALAFAGLSSVALSFILKRRFYKQAAERHDPAQFQTGFVLALVLCEVSALFGLVGLFTTWNMYAYALFVLGALGIALHFPRRDDLAAAYFKGGYT